MWFSKAKKLIAPIDLGEHELHACEYVTEQFKQLPYCLYVSGSNPRSSMLTNTQKGRNGCPQLPNHETHKTLKRRGDILSAGS